MTEKSWPGSERKSHHQNVQEIIIQT